MTIALTDEEIEDRFFILDQLQIIAMLGQFIYKSIPVTVQFNNGSDFILTTLLEAKHESLIFDLGGSPESNNLLLKTNSCTFVTSVNGIRVQFSTSGGVRKVWWDDAEAFAVKLPTRLIRLQRRETFRVTMPVVKFVPVRLQYDKTEAGCDKTYPIHDLSVSGLGVTFPDQPDLEVGQAIGHVTFALPKSRKIECGGIICHVTKIAEGPKSYSHRGGIRFKNLPRPMEIAIQRYIIALEQVRHKLAMESI